MIISHRICADLRTDPGEGGQFPPFAPPPVATQLPPADNYPKMTAARH